MAAPAFTAPDIAIMYYTVAAVCAVGLLLTIQDFFAPD